MCILRTLPGVFQFTFHNVSINTWSNITSNNRLSVFTFHNVSINTMRSAKCRYAHSTFTFHNVSINTRTAVSWRNRPHSFTFHNVSINTRDDRARYHRKKNLHSTMFLLIPAGASALSDSAFKFTFHNVSINTLLLIRRKLCVKEFTFHNVSINTSTRPTMQQRFIIYIPQCFY